MTIERPSSHDRAHYWEVLAIALNKCAYIYYLYFYSDIPPEAVFILEIRSYPGPEQGSVKGAGCNLQRFIISLFEGAIAAPLAGDPVQQTLQITATARIIGSHKIRVLRYDVEIRSGGCVGSNLIDINRISSGKVMFSLACENLMIKLCPERLERILPFFVGGALWYLLIAHLSVHWVTNAEYSFGWFGPLICVYLFFIRWISRPPAERAHSTAVKALFCVAGLGLLPTWLFEQPNPDWRLISWLLASEVVILTMCAIYFLGGKPWVGHFAFSVCLILTTVPWPHEMDKAITQGLMQVATAATVACLHLFDVQAVQHGNLIEVKTGLLGVEEACSGIGSLHTTLMVSYLLGELYRAPWQRRIALVLCGILTAFVCNVGRAFLLSYVAAVHGTHAISQWHDPAGLIILAVSFFAVWSFAHLFSGTPPRLQCCQGTPPNPLPEKLMIGLAAWLLFTLLGTETWYRAHEGADAVRWSVEWPASKAHFTNVPISAREAEQLGFDEGSAASWTDSDASHWAGFFFKWAAGPVGSRVRARVHRPEICLPAAGYTLQADRGIIAIKAKDLMIPFHALEFEYGGEPVHVFFCLWEDRPRSAAQSKIRLDWDRFARVESVLLGERNLGQRVLELVSFGRTTPEHAESVLRHQIENLIRI